LSDLEKLSDLGTFHVESVLGVESRKIFDQSDDSSSFCPVDALFADDWE
jgi:hypothetical protein